jgi:YqaJ-like recombinase protein
MPDPLRQTISATESSALFDVSPYVTLWMLYRRFAHGEEAAVATHARMDWGTKLEPLVLAQAAEDLKFEVRPNRGEDGKQVYIRNGLLGCTRDADVFCPDRGPGACETKCVFDYRIWMQEWDGGNHPPRHHEIQLQQQMKVGDGKTSYKWGVEVVWVAGELYYFERKPIPKFWDALDTEAARFFADVKAGNEPEPFGSPREWPLLNEAFPIEETKILDLREAPEGRTLAEEVRLYDYHRKQRLGHEKGEDGIKLKLRTFAKECGKILLPFGINVQLKQNKTSVGIKTYIPADAPEGGLEDFEGAALGG